MAVNNIVRTFLTEELAKLNSTVDAATREVAVAQERLREAEADLDFWASRRIVAQERIDAIQETLSED